MNYKQVAKSISQIVLFSIIFIFLVFIVNEFSKDKITQNKQDFLLKQLNQLVMDYDNDILVDSYTKNVNLYGKNQDLIIYPAKKDNKIFAKLIKHTYPKGYSGDITLLTAVDNNDKIIGVRVLEHKETPGLGDKIEFKKSNWILSFNNKSLANTNKNLWQVKKYGGEFDSFTGATITPQAVITATYELLQYLENNEN